MAFFVDLVRGTPAYFDELHKGNSAQRKEGVSKIVKECDSAFACICMVSTALTPKRPPNMFRYPPCAP